MLSFAFGSPAAVPHSSECGNGGGTHAGDRYPAALYEFWGFQYLDVFLGIGAGQQRPPQKVCELARRARKGAFGEKSIREPVETPATWARKRGNAARKRPSWATGVVPGRMVYEEIASPPSASVSS